ncbi:MAG: 3-oxoacyl-ACP synthase [Rhizobiales bacterium 65-79]|nr:MAG: 3-oxoacyl-ACP synthase [Rhizobiales bacterium 65-79]
MNISDRRLKELAARRDEDIDYSDIPELDKAFWDKARLVLPKPSKQQMTIRFDTDMVEWFKARGKGYQSHMNAVLRAYMEAHR